MEVIIICLLMMTLNLFAFQSFKRVNNVHIQFKPYGSKLQRLFSSREGRSEKKLASKPTAVSRKKPAEKYSSREKTRAKDRPIPYISLTSNVSPVQSDDSESTSSSDRPFTLPAGQFRPKQSLGQNYLSDQNYVNKIVTSFRENREKILGSSINDDQGKFVVEIGPGTGALTRSLFPLFPKMTAVEIDQRAVAFLQDKLPSLKIKHQDVLTVDWFQANEEQRTQFSQHELGDDREKISIVANLPYYIVSQVLFSLADAHQVINLACVTMQLEVAERITAKPRTKDYGIPSIVFQLYAQTKLLFKIPPSVFFPPPKVDSALILVDFTKPHPLLNTVNTDCLRRVVTFAFQQRRKMLRQSLKELITKEQLTLPEQWATKRPEELTPVQFIELTHAMYGDRAKVEDNITNNRHAVRRGTWRKSLFENETNEKNSKRRLESIEEISEEI